MKQDPAALSLNFRSDNVGTVRPEILRALEAANHGPAAAYGDDEWSARVNAAFSEMFETPVTVFPAATGTAANAISLSCLARPWGGIYCHQEAHVHTSEGGATEFYGAGAKLLPLPGENFKLTASELDTALTHAERGIRNKPQPDALTLTQATEYGTVYSCDELAAIGEVARRHALAVHMDGARFGNALATLGCSAAELLRCAGLDMLSFGTTKNGGMNAEAIVVFDQDLVEPLSYRLRRAGQTWSKMRFAAAQLLAYIEDQRFLEWAAHSNAVATRLANGLGALPGVELIAPVQANLLFLTVPEAMRAAFTAAGARFGTRRGGVIRLVTRADMPEAEADRLIEIARGAVIS